MPIPYMKAKAGRFGIVPVFVASPANGTWTANTTTTGRIPTPKRKCYVVSASIQASTLPADADGTFLLTIKKYDASADTAVTISDQENLEALMTHVDVAYEVTISSSATDAQRMIEEGDTLYYEVVNNSAAIDTQAVNCFVVVELAVME
jgi:hypothetical protein